MALYYSIPLFLGSLTLVIAGSVLLSRLMGGLGKQCNIPEQFLGFLTALGADSPEISSAVVAMLSGHTDTGVGVVFGSNLFNLAALLGLAAVLAGSIEVRREPVLLEGGVGIAIVAIAVSLVLGGIGASLALGLLLGVIVPYAILLALRRDSLEKLTFLGPLQSFIVSAASESQEHSRQVQRTVTEDEEKRQRQETKQEDKQPHSSARKLLLEVVGTLIVIVLGSVGLVHSTTALTSGWLPQGLLGTLVLAALTGIPNLYTAVRLAKRHRGSAVFTEAMNSNSLNIIVGLAIPSLVFGSLSPHTMGGYLDIAWLLFMTIGVVVLLAVSRGLTKKEGQAIIVAYVVFVVVRVYLSY